VRLDHLLSKEHLAAQLSSFSFRGRTCHGEECSLVERRLVGLILIEDSSVLLLAAWNLEFERWNIPGTLLGPEGSSLTQSLVGRPSR